MRLSKNYEKGFRDRAAGQKDFFDTLKTNTCIYPQKLVECKKGEVFP